jgi:phthalate 4,5-dioxygenase oxygenase subunit
MGKIYNRSKEHLGTSDMGIITMRRRLIKAAKAFAETGQTPAEAMTPEVYAIRSDAVLIPAAAPWFPSTENRRKITASNPDCPI